jgi:peptide-methionine (S)-S-oxide reductase
MNPLSNRRPDMKPLPIKYCLLAFVLVGGCQAADGPAKPVEPPTPSNTSKAKPSKGENKMSELETVTLGAGCFWCIEAVLDRIKGVESVESGYMGGKLENPSYEDVCTGLTGHAEVVRVKFDPQELPFEKLLDIFWQLHDPTQVNRQGPDTGTQYRSAIFYHTDEQRDAAEKSKKKWDESGKLSGPIVTEITRASKFYPAENYHQEFFARNPNNVYCQINILPKFKKLGLLRENEK